MLTLNKHSKIVESSLFSSPLFHTSSSQVFSTFVGDLKEEVHYMVYCTNAVLQQQEIYRKGSSWTRINMMNLIMKLI
uniref:Uncharacterized protein n=1 Tax=Arundo donax TaxID=35708 RepID=A0A0A8YFJ9_ARUDO